MVSGAFLSLTSVALTAAELRPILEMAKPILEAVPEVSESKQVLTHLSGGIELNNASFRYREGMPNVIDDLSLKIRPGQYVAIVGAMGCGKSNLMRLLLGFETPPEGGRLLRREGPEHHRPQEPAAARRRGDAGREALLGGHLLQHRHLRPLLTMDDAWAAGGKGFVDPITRKRDRVLAHEKQAQRKYTSEFSPPEKG